MGAEQKSNGLEMEVRNNPVLEFIMCPEWILFPQNPSVCHPPN